MTSRTVQPIGARNLFCMVGLALALQCICAIAQSSIGGGSGYWKPWPVQSAVARIEHVARKPVFSLPELFAAVSFTGGKVRAPRSLFISAFQKFRFSPSVPHTSFQTFLREADNVVAVLCERRCPGETPKHQAVIGGRRSSLNAKIVMAIVANRRTTQSPI